MPVLSIAILKLLSSARNSSGCKSSKLDISMLYIYDVDCESFLHILTLMMWIVCSSSQYTLMMGIGGFSLRAGTSPLNHGPFFMDNILIC